MAHHSKALRKIHPLFGILLLGLFMLIGGCGGGGDSSKDTPSPTVTSFVETSGHVGDTVIITGTNFSTTNANNTVKFNGTTAVVDSSSATQVKAFVPVGATTGKISVTVSGNTATSSSDFTVTSNTPVFSGYYLNDTLVDIPCYWTGIGGTTARNDLAGDGTHDAYAYSTFLASDGEEYTAGFYDNGSINIACYWKGTTIKALRYNNDGLTNNDDTYALSITESNGIIYVSGFYSDFATGMDVPCYWTITNSDITRTDLDIVDKTKYNGYANSIAIYNGTIYTAGYYTNKEDLNSSDIACYWTGTVRIDLGDGINASEAYSIAVSGGTVYTAGRYLDNACYWTATARTDLTDDSVNYANATSIAIYNGAVYSSGFYNDGSKDIPCYWTGTSRTDLAGDGTHDAEAFSIIVSGGTVYAGGVYYNGTKDIPCYWTGTIQTPVNIGDNVHGSKVLSPFAKVTGYWDLTSI
jgi:hypothetical protein